MPRETETTSYKTGKIIGLLIETITLSCLLSFFIGAVGWVWSSNNLWTHLAVSSVIILVGNLLVLCLIKGSKNG